MSRIIIKVHKYNVRPYVMDFILMNIIPMNSFLKPIYTYFTAKLSYKQWKSRRNWCVDFEMTMIRLSEILQKENELWPKFLRIQFLISSWRICGYWCYSVENSKLLASRLKRKFPWNKSFEVAENFQRFFLFELNVRCRNISAWWWEMNGCW